MRRSAAPSQGGVPKRPRFTAPFKTPILQVTENSANKEKLPEEKHTTAEVTHTPNTSRLKVAQTGFKSPLSQNSSNIDNADKGDNPVKKLELKEVVMTTGPVADENSRKKRYLSVMWCKRSNKKHKKWEGDAVLITIGRSVTLVDMEGKEIGKGTGYKSTELEILKEDETLMIGGKEIQVMSVLTEEQFKSGKCFSTSSSSEPVRTKALIDTDRVTNKPFMKPYVAGSSIAAEKCTVTQCIPRYNPGLPDALVMPRPSKNHQWQNNRTSLPIVDVVLDPYLSVHLRPHQREGMVFLYECVMGYREYSGQGAILADDMGLGKTLQCISLIWTLLKQGPYGGKPIIKQALIITPGSLVKNWSQEIKKWLGSERLSVYAVSTEKRIEDFVNTKIYPVLIISYEMFIRAYEKIQLLKFDIIICDEGHRLKNTAIKTTSLIMSLPCRRRVVLTGTPIQNDLQEFYSIVEFCNPGILGSSSGFKHVYESPILAARQPGASRETVELGEERGSELARLTKLFLLRRSQEVNNKYLPPKCEIVIFCRPSRLQIQLYEALLSGRLFRSCLSGRFDGSPHLICIGALKQLCNHPSLIYSKAEEADRCSDDPEEDSVYQDLFAVYPDNFLVSEDLETHSGKLKVLGHLLAELHKSSPTEKIVLVSNHTKTLDLLQKFCDNLGYSYCRLDGQTPTSRRQEIVTNFNSKFSNQFVFLLSSKAGGVGLNLIGASRLVLYDIDWNPANDLQAMARVWRDGQKKQVFIYRLLTTGTIEEKIYQRQISKQGLSGAVMQTKSNNEIQFSREDLKDLFSLAVNTDCDTHELLNCDCQTSQNQCDMLGEDPKPAVRKCQLGTSSVTSNMKSKRNLGMDELMDWKHGRAVDQYSDWFLCGAEGISFLFWHESKS